MKRQQKRPTRSEACFTRTKKRIKIVYDYTSIVVLPALAAKSHPKRKSFALKELHIPTKNRFKRLGLKVVLVPGKLIPSLTMIIVSID